MLRMVSIARIRPTRSSRVRCWVTSAGTSAGSVSVAMWRSISLVVVGARDRRRRLVSLARDLRDESQSRLTVPDSRARYGPDHGGGWGDPAGRAPLAGPAALADARRLAVADVPRAHPGRRRAAVGAAAVRLRARRRTARDPARR